MSLKNALMVSPYFAFLDAVAIASACDYHRTIIVETGVRLDTSQSQNRVQKTEMI